MDHSPPAPVNGAPAEVTSPQLMALLGYGDGPGDECELCGRGTAEHPGPRVRVEVAPFKLNPASPVTFTELTGCGPCLLLASAGDWSAALARGEARQLVEGYRAHWLGAVLFVGDVPYPFRLYSRERAQALITEWCTAGEAARIALSRTVLFDALGAEVVAGIVGCELVEDDAHFSTEALVFLVGQILGASTRPGV